MFLTRIQSWQIVFVVRIDVWMQLCVFLWFALMSGMQLCVFLWHICSHQHHIFHRYFHNFTQILKSNQPFKWIVIEDPKMKKASLIGKGEFMVGSIILPSIMIRELASCLQQFSVPQIEYPLGGSTKKSSHVYFLLIVAMVLLLWRQIVLLWLQDNIYIKQ